MRVTVEQAGGYVGFLRKRVDTSELEPEEEAMLRSLVEQSNLPGMTGERQPQSRNVPSYVVTVETDDGEQHEVAFDDTTRSEGAASLLRYVQQRGKPLPPP